jgi:hypothetical protein
MQYTRKQVIILPPGGKHHAYCAGLPAAETLLHARKPFGPGTKLREMLSRNDEIEPRLYVSDPYARSGKGDQYGFS